MPSSGRTRQLVSELVDGFVVATGAERIHPMSVVGISKRVELAGAPSPGQCFVHTSLAQQPAGSPPCAAASLGFNSSARLYPASASAQLPLLLLYVCQQDVRFGKFRIQFQRLWAA